MENYDEVVAMPTIEESLNDLRNIDPTTEQQTKQAGASLILGQLQNQLENVDNIGGILSLMPTILNTVSDMNVQGSSIPYYQSSVEKVGLDNYNADVAYTNQLKKYRDMINNPINKNDKNVETLKNRYDSLLAVDRTLENMKRFAALDDDAKIQVKEDIILHEAQKNKILKQMDSLSKEIEQTEILRQRPHVSQEMALKQELKEIKRTIQLNPSLKDNYKDFISKHQKEWDEMNAQDLKDKQFYDEPINQLSRNKELNELEDKRQRLLRKVYRKTTPLKRQKYTFDLNKKEAKMQETAKKFVDNMNETERESFKASYKRYAEAERKIKENKKIKQQQENIKMAEKMALQNALADMETKNEGLLLMWGDSLFGHGFGVRALGSKALNKFVEYMADYMKNTHIKH